MPQMGLWPLSLIFYKYMCAKGRMRHKLEAKKKKKSVEISM